jgi:hypothetical protein
MLKIYEKKSQMYIWTFYIHSQKFVEKKDILCGLLKKDKNMARKKLFWITGNCHFYTDHKKYHFFAKDSVWT